MGTTQARDCTRKEELPLAGLVHLRAGQDRLRLRVSSTGIEHAVGFNSICAPAGLPQCAWEASTWAELQQHLCMGTVAAGYIYLSLSLPTLSLTLSNSVLSLSLDVLISLDVFKF